MSVYIQAEEDTIKTKDFLEMIVGNSKNTIHLRNLNKFKEVTGEYWINPNDYDSESLDKAFTNESLEKELNIFFQVGLVEHGSKQPKEVSVIWADCDSYKYPGGEAQVYELLKQLPKPTVTVRSGRGLHFYWKLTEPLDARGIMSPAQRITKNVQWKLGGDPAHAPNKPLRVPNTFNFKPDDYEGGKECKVIENNDLVYTPEDFPIDEVLSRVAHKTMQMIVLGPTEVNTDASSYDFMCVSRLIREGFNADEVKHLLYTYAFSGKASREGSNKVNYIDRTIRSATFRVQVSPGNETKASKPISWSGKTLSDIRKEPKPTFIINDFLPKAGVGIIAGPPKSRKSWCALELAYGVANATSWLGFTIPEKRKTLYIQAELPDWMVADRVDQMYGSNEQLENVKFHYIPAANLAEDQDMEGLLNEVKEFEAELVIIDPISNFWQGDENGSSSVNALFDQITKIQELGCAVIIIHHSRKTMPNERLSPQHQRGSNVFFARPSAILTLSPMQDETIPYTWVDLSLRAAAPREPFKLYAGLDGKFLLQQPSIPETTISPVKRMILENKLKAMKGGEQIA